MEKFKQNPGRKSTTEFIIVMPLEEVTRRLESQRQFRAKPVSNSDGKMTYEITLARFIGHSAYTHKFHLLVLSRWNTTETKVNIRNSLQERWTPMARKLFGVYILVAFVISLVTFVDLRICPVAIFLFGWGFSMYLGKDPRRNSEVSLDVIITTLTSMAETDYVRST